MVTAFHIPSEQGALTFEEFLAKYGDDDRYELIDGEVFDLEPTGPHEQVAAFITRKLNVQIDQLDLPYCILQRGIIKPPKTLLGLSTAFRPDVMVVDESALMLEPLWQQQSVLMRGSSIKFVAEVVSSNWQNDYSRKFEDFALLGIPEYWIADYLGLGGIHYIGKPKQPTLTICTLVDDAYETKLYRGDDSIISAMFPALDLTAAQVLRLQP
jgi:Uma2 family endonuclease